MGNVNRPRQIRTGLLWLEVLLGLAFISLLVQLFPSLATILDARKWSRSTWFIINSAVIAILLAIRFAPDFYEGWCDHQEQKRAEWKKEKAKRELQEERETFERLQRARSRRIY